MKYNLLIFDWDGTLVDSAARIVSSFQGAARELGFAVPSDASVREVIGLGLPEAIARAMPDLSAEQIELMRSGYSDHYLYDNTTPVRLFDQVEEGLSRLVDSGYRLAVATGKSRRGLDRILDDTGLRSMFEVTRCADETCSKPDPQMLYEILEQTSVDASQALMIGDTEYDLEMARRANMSRVAVHYGVHDVDRLRACEPVFEMNHFGQLVDWLHKDWE